MNRPPFYRQLYFWVLVGMVLGVILGYLTPVGHPWKGNLFGAEFTFTGTDLKPVSDGFIRLIRMMIAPIIFTTVVTGIAGMGNLKRLGRIGLKAFLYFEVMTTLALTIGWIVAAVVRRLRRHLQPARSGGDPGSSRSGCPARPPARRSGRLDR